VSSSSFNDAAKYYDEVRPGYPDLLYEDIMNKSHIPEGGTILEIGCGTGQATLPLAKRGYKIICVEQGANLIKIAKKKCQGLDVTFINDSFESWTPLKTGFDLVISATAFHWINPNIGFPKVTKLLKDDGYIAFFWNLHPKPYTEFFIEVQSIYQRLVPEWFTPQKRPVLEDRIKELNEDIKKSNLFKEQSYTQYKWSRIYSADNYIKLLDTYSDHRQLDENRRNALYENIHKLIEENYEGYIVRPYLTVLIMAKKRN
jgi:SAM-dependent methyltransferase